MVETNANTNEKANMRILYKVPGFETIITTCPDDLHEEQNLVQGFIEPLYLNDNVVLVCNEEGKILGMPPCIDLHKDGEMIEMINGPIFLCSADEDGGFVGLSDEMIAKYKVMLDSNVIEL